MQSNKRKDQILHSEVCHSKSVKDIYSSSSQLWKVFWWGLGGLFDYSVTPGPSFCDSKLLRRGNHQVPIFERFFWWWWWWGGLFDYSVTPGPSFGAPDNECWILGLTWFWTLTRTLTWTWDRTWSLTTVSSVFSRIYFVYVWIWNIVLDMTVQCNL